MKELSDIKNLKRIQKELKEFDKIMKLIKQYPTKLMKKVYHTEYEIGI